MVAWARNNHSWECKWYNTILLLFSHRVGLPKSDCKFGYLSLYIHGLFENHSADRLASW